ncbi:DUF2089 family protein [Streptococcus moroccensis]|uniref:DUF2089 family protein n=1 Tax=Streptococcus moroccensis TaxID=1451356 RepID=A0ABT9YT33_9STRE|nr:DUF2089 family protein [Streptococcus moroccensis]MDQ0223151.1 hypothetical protein [Streptococcus moroccensis]
MAKEKLPVWLTELETEDIEFIRRFILASGSLKEMASYYEISYPTIRLRLDRLIEKVSQQHQPEESYVNLIKELALDGELSFEVAKKLITSYREERK